jgi:phosphoglycolate phosphatase
MHRLWPHLKNKSHVIFDWNGTLLDDLEVCHLTISEILHLFELPPITREHYRNIFCFPVRDYYQELGFDLNTIDFDRLSREFVSRYRKYSSACRLVPGTVGLLETLHQSGISCSVLSALFEPDLKQMLDRHKISVFFANVFGLKDHYAHSKLKRGRELLEKIEEANADIVMIGDTDHDAEVAKALGITPLLVDHGHQSYQRLARSGHMVMKMIDLPHGLNV